MTDLFARILHPAGTARPSANDRNEASAARVIAAANATPEQIAELRDRVRAMSAPRPNLCRTLGTHDPRNGTCADCGVTLTDDDPVCPESAAFLAELNGGRGVQ